MARIQDRDSTTELDCLLYGGFAGGTVGDEIALAVALKDAAQRFGPRVAILSRDPALTARLFPDAEIVPYSPILTPRRHNLPFLGQRPTYEPRDQVDGNGAALPWVRAIARSRRLHLVGGGYLNDIWDVWFSLLPIRVAARAGVSISTAPIQIGPFYSDRHLRAVREAFQAAPIAVRDRASLALCDAHGIAASLAIDDVFRVNEVVDCARERRFATGRPRIGICVFRQNGTDIQQFESWWTEFLLTLVRVCDLEIAGFAFHSYPGYDHADTVELFACAGLSADSVLPPPADFREAVQQLGGFDVVATCRFHAAAIASVLAIPVLAFGSGDYYTAKLTAAWPDHLSEPYAAHLGEISPEEAAKRLVEATLT